MFHKLILPIYITDVKVSQLFYLTLFRNNTTLLNFFLMVFFLLQTPFVPKEPTVPQLVSILLN